jgi:aryl-alcohol dehydrogenase-like predicted oxidoreductase
MGNAWTRTVGRAGLPATAIGLGLAALGRPGYLNVGHGADLGPDRSVAALERRTHEMLDAARAAGVRYFDVARSYGRAEAFLSSWLRSRALEPGEVTVASKWGYTYTADWQVQADAPEVKDLSVDTLRRQLDETRELLGDHLGPATTEQLMSNLAALEVPWDDEADAALEGLAEPPEAYWQARGELVWN